MTEKLSVVDNEDFQNMKKKDWMEKWAVKWRIEMVGTVLTIVLYRLNFRAKYTMNGRKLKSTIHRGYLAFNKSIVCLKWQHH